MTAPKLGIGLNYQPQLRAFIEEWAGAAFDFLEVVPDIFWLDYGRGARPRYVDDPNGWEFLSRIRERVPVIPHSIGLSIGSAHRFNREHIGQMKQCFERLQFPWHSDHLSFHLTGHEDQTRLREDNVGITMPLPRTRKTIAMLADRVAEVRAAINAPFLLENNVYFVELPAAEMEEADFLNTVSRVTGCGLLLDLHNVYTNARNLGLDAMEFLEELDLDNVIEIHLGGGFEKD